MIGARDLELAITTMSVSSGWTQDAFESLVIDHVKRASFANKTIAFQWVSVEGGTQDWIFYNSRPSAVVHIPIFTADVPL